MKRVATIALVVSLTVLSTAQAASVHFKKAPKITENPNNTLTFAGSLTGLGNQDITITIVAEGDASVILLNPSGQYVPGQNRVPILTGASVTISSTQIKNGNVSFSLTSAEPENPTWEEAGAPNANWQAFIDEVDFDSVTIVVQQGGRIVLTKTFVP
jgi:hypothetical protein